MVQWTRKTKKTTTSMVLRYVNVASSFLTIFNVAYFFSSRTVDNFSWNESNFLSRTKSEVSLAGTIGRSVSSKEVQVSFINCKESRSFTSAFEQLDLDVNSKDSTELVQRTCDVQTDPLYDQEAENMITSFQTREIPSFRLVIQGPEILKFQGTKHAIKDIARYWKKDSRMWLWKSGQRMNNQQQPEYSMYLCTSEQNFKRFQ